MVFFQFEDFTPNADSDFLRQGAIANRGRDRGDITHLVSEIDSRTEKSPRPAAVKALIRFLERRSSDFSSNPRRRPAGPDLLPRVLLPVLAGLSVNGPYQATSCRD
jgi:hypothetical protein